MIRMTSLALFCASMLILFSGWSCPFRDGFSYSRDDDGFIPYLAAPSLDDCCCGCGSTVSPYNYLGNWAFGDWGTGYIDYDARTPGLWKPVSD